MLLDNNHPAHSRASSISMFAHRSSPFCYLQIQTKCWRLNMGKKQRIMHLGTRLLKQIHSTGQGNSSWENLHPIFLVPHEIDVHSGIKCGQARHGLNSPSRNTTSRTSVSMRCTYCHIWITSSAVPWKWNANTNPQKHQSQVNYRSAWFSDATLAMQRREASWFTVATRPLTTMAHIIVIETILPGTTQDSYSNTHCVGCIIYTK